MNLYKVNVLHIAPKSQCMAMVCMVLAESDGEVDEWLKTEPTVNGNELLNSWSEFEELIMNLKIILYLLKVSVMIWIMIAQTLIMVLHYMGGS